MIPESLKRYGPTETMRRHRDDEANAHDYDMALSRGDTWYKRDKPCPKCHTRLYYTKQPSVCRKCNLRRTRVNLAKRKYGRDEPMDRRHIDRLIEQREIDAQTKEVWE